MTVSGLSVTDLTVAYEGGTGRQTTVVWRASLELQKGRIQGLAGESGCGKSTLALAAIGYHDQAAVIIEGCSQLGDVDLLTLRPAELTKVWGRRVAYVGQSAATSLNPSLTIGSQLGELLDLYRGEGRRSRDRQAELLDEVGIPDPRAALSRYPHQFSGGQQQRISIAMALCGAPEVVILDEPTTGLDVTTQARITALLRTKLAKSDTATLYISHDLALLSTVTDWITIMYAGEVVEEGPTERVLRSPRHPYTLALLSAVPSASEDRPVVGLPGRPPAAVVTSRCAFAPRCGAAAQVCLNEHAELEPTDHGSRVRCHRWRELAERNVASIAGPATSRKTGEPILTVRDLSVRYPSAPRFAVEGVSLELAEAETVGIVGESGSGKSTLLRAIAGVVALTAGSVRFRDDVLPTGARERTREVLSQIQLVFQNPESSLNPRHTIGEAIRRPLRLFRADVPHSQEDHEISALISAVRLPATVVRRYPGELSGGQRQRVALARAFAAKPLVLLCDEVTSALDVSVQAAVLETLAELVTLTGTAVLFVSHDLGVVRTIAARTLVMRDGIVVEQRATKDLFSDPHAPYTQELLSAIPSVGGAPVRPSANGSAVVSGALRGDVTG